MNFFLIKKKQQHPGAPKSDQSKNDYQSKKSLNTSAGSIASTSTSSLLRNKNTQKIFENSGKK